MEGKKKCTVEKRRPSKSIFDVDKEADTEEEKKNNVLKSKVGKRTSFSSGDAEEENDVPKSKVGKRTSFSSESSNCASGSGQYVSRGIENLSESSSSEESDDEPLVKRTSDNNISIGSGTADVESDQDSDSENVSEYFDFSEIISTQQKIKDLEAIKNNTVDCDVPEKKKLESFSIEDLPPKIQKGRGRRNKLCTSKRVPKRKENTSEEQLDVSQLLAMGEKKTASDSQSDSDDEGEEADVGETLQPNPQKEIQVRIDLPTRITKKKKTFDIDSALKRRLNAIRKDNQVFVHKVHLLCLIAHGNMVNNVLNSEALLASALSIVPSEKFYPPKLATLEYLEKLVIWFTKKVGVADKPPESKLDLKKLLLCQFSECNAHSVMNKVMMFICVARVLGLKCRYVVNLQPAPLRPPREDLIALNSKKDDGKEEVLSPEEASSSEDDFTEVVETVKSKAIGKPKVSRSNYFDQIDTKNNKVKNKKTPEKGKSPKNTKQEKPSTSKNSQKNSKVTKSTRKRSVATHTDKSPKDTSKKKLTSKDRRVLSSDSDDLIVKKKKKKVGSDVWSEVFLESEEKWIAVDINRGKIHCIDQIQSLCSQPIVYVLGWNDDCTFKDLTKRYAPQWMTTTRRLRVETTWWDRTVKPWKPKRTAREKEEDYQLDKILEDKPMPATISEYKNHPLFVLMRHLLKFEAIYPPDAPPLGFVKGEAVYSRLCVAELHSRETWMRQAKSIRVDEKPYKIVKSRPKYDKLTQSILNDLPLEIFGHWQVEDYQPPVAVDGVVPRNDYGNVELYKPCMLPIGTVHLQIPGLLRVARKLKIDCAPALVGWEHNSGSSFPVLDGFIVCEEFKDTLLDHWNKSIDETAQREKEKIDQRVYGNWRRLIKGLIIRERLEKKYNFGPLKEPKKKPTKRKHRN